MGRLDNDFCPSPTEPTALWKGISNRYKEKKYTCCTESLAMHDHSSGSLVCLYAEINQPRNKEFAYEAIKTGAVLGH